jgi:hypothetical protein
MNEGLKVLMSRRKRQRNDVLIVIEISFIDV